MLILPYLSNAKVKTIHIPHTKFLICIQFALFNKISLNSFVAFYRSTIFLNTIELELSFLINCYFNRIKVVSDEICTIITLMKSKYIIIWIFLRNFMEYIFLDFSIRFEDN